MKTTMGLLAATAATAYAGHCCCTYTVLSASASYLYRCNNDGDNANYQTQTFSEANCNGDAITDFTNTFSGSCDNLSGGGFDQTSCDSWTITGFSLTCTWKDGAAEASLASAAAATAAVVGYTFA
eukprot:CAMPEP_0170558258 /NCGR_PEP_ID=MMETSP0211-20121228/33985_1 /TAXON_ID=311385 /ORGANISM="Pseudokeronopsis sp., Strain OXSARD2" /LENGTH=124 /DNA_ID=CAMNT_0010870039 /DNA_START=15 /DNA_END=389 /DNA_ORIENTATION=+